MQEPFEFLAVYLHVSRAYLQYNAAKLQAESWQD